MQLSIIIPVYQVEAYVSECLDSLVRQAKEVSMQVIIVDDGSFDGSAQIVRHYTDQYPKLFEYYKKENGGLSDARNYGVPFARGTYLMFLDGDDYLADHACKTILDTFERTDADLLFFNYIPFDENVRKVHKVCSGTSRFVSDKEYLLCPPTAWNKVMKTEAYRNGKIRFPKGIWYEDLATTGAYVKFAKNIYYLDEGLYYYRQRMNSIMNQGAFTHKMMDIQRAITSIMGQLDTTRYHEELEYLCISNLIYQSAERLLAYHRKKEVDDLVLMTNRWFPAWQSNLYYQKRSRLYRMTCQAVARKRYHFAKLLYAFKNKMV